MSIIASLGAISPVIAVTLIVAVVIVLLFTKPYIDIANKKICFGKVRSCGDCIKLMRARQSAFEAAYSLKENSILKQQMIFVEHKLLEIQLITQSEIHFSVKDEIRRSMKENGFFDMNEADYYKYIVDRCETLQLMLNSKDQIIDTIIKEMYDNAISTKSRVQKELIELEVNFIKDLNEIIK